MRILHTLVVMFIGSFIVQYFCMSSIMSNSRINITNSLSKLYMSIIMGLFMIILELMMRDNQYKVLSTNSYLFFGGLLIILIYLYRNQVGVNDKQYIEEMIEHHSMALLTSDEIINKTNDFNVMKLAKNIKQKQEDEIKQMRGLLKRNI